MSQGISSLGIVLVFLEYSRAQMENVHTDSFSHREASLVIAIDYYQF